MVTSVVSFDAKYAIGCGLLMSVLFIAAGGLAQADAVGQAGGEAMAQAQGSYHADGNGAVDAADEEQQSSREEAADHVRNSGDGYEQIEGEASSQMNAEYEKPDCECRDELAQVEEQGHGQFATAEHVEQQTGVENEYVDAGADVEATGQAEAWYDQLFSGVTDAFDKVESAMNLDNDVQQKAHAEVDQRLQTDDELREKAAQQLEQDVELSEKADPSASGEVDGQHRADAASETVAGGSAP